MRSGYYDLYQAKRAVTSAGKSFSCDSINFESLAILSDMILLPELLHLRRGICWQSISTQLFLPEDSSTDARIILNTWKGHTWTKFGEFEHWHIDVAAGQTTPDEPHSSFASADAARVGGGMYTFVLEALCTLATDPTKIVQKMGQTALRAAGVELQPVIGRQGTQNAQFAILSIMCLWECSHKKQSLSYTFSMDHVLAW